MSARGGHLVVTATAAYFEMFDLVSNGPKLDWVEICFQESQNFDQIQNLTGAGRTFKDMENQFENRFSDSCATICRDCCG